MKSIPIIVLTSLLLVSCATVNDTYTADGRKAYTLNCSGSARGWDKCLKAAGDLCGSSGYKVLDKTAEDVAGGGASTTFFAFEKNYERSMMIACNK